MRSLLTSRDVRHALHIARRQRDDAADRKARSEYKTSQMTQSVEVLAGALSVGVLGGRYGRTVLFGQSWLDVDLLAGLALMGVGYAGWTGKWSDHLHNLGDGVLAGYVTKLGAQIGNNLRASANEPGLMPGTDGVAAIGKGSSNYNYVSENEIAQMARALR